MDIYLCIYVYMYICDALPWKVHKVAGSDWKMWPNLVDFELINFSVTLATFWVLIFIKKWLISVIFRLVVGLNAAYFSQKHTVFKRCGEWSHSDKGHVWCINGNLVYPWILSLPLNEHSLFLSQVNCLQMWQTSHKMGPVKIQNSKRP